LSAKAIYIDAERTFRWERIEAMAKAVGLDPDKAMANTGSELYRAIIRWL
jgi:DNA repair protein RadA